MVHLGLTTISFKLQVKERDLSYFNINVFSLSRDKNFRLHYSTSKDQNRCSIIVDIIIETTKIENAKELIEFIENFYWDEPGL